MMNTTSVVQKALGRRGRSRQAGGPPCMRGLAGAAAPFTCVWWVVMMMLLVVLMCANSVLSDGGDCPVRTDAVDVQSKAYVSAQVVEATVQGEVAQVPQGQPYTVSFVVSRSLRRYRGPGRIKKKATLVLTFLRPATGSSSRPNRGQQQSDPAAAAAETDSDAGAVTGTGAAAASDQQCLVEAAIRSRRKYVLFLSGAGGGRSTGDSSSSGSGGPNQAVVPVAAPVPASKKLRRIIKKIACSKCGTRGGGGGVHARPRPRRPRPNSSSGPRRPPPSGALRPTRPQSPHAGAIGPSPHPSQPGAVAGSNTNRHHLPPTRVQSQLTPSITTSTTTTTTTRPRPSTTTPTTNPRRGPNDGDLPALSPGSNAVHRLAFSPPVSRVELESNDILDSPPPQAPPAAGSTSSHQNPIRHAASRPYLPPAAVAGSSTASAGGDVHRLATVDRDDDQEPPSDNGMAPVVKGLRDDSIVSNQTLVLECSIQGTPLPVITWYKDGAQLLPTDRHKISSTRPRRDRGRSPRNARGGGGGSSSRRGHVMGQVARRRGKRRRGRPPVGAVTTAGAAVAEDDNPATAANTADNPTDTQDRTRRRKGNGRKGDRRNGSSSSRRGRGRSRGSRRRGDNSTKGNSSEPPAEGAGGSQRRKPGSRDPSQQPGGGSPTTSVTVVSVLEVSRVTAQDVGLYKCVATNVVGEAHSQAHIRVVKPIEPHPGVKYCDPDHASYCLNGGTCMLYTDFNEYICICPEGYKGHRCQEKEVYPTFVDYYRHPSRRHRSKGALLYGR